MKLKLKLIFSSILLVSICALFSSCHHEDWKADDNVLTDASHGGLTNHHVVATGEVQNVTYNSATILFSANYNYKESLGIKPVIIYSDKYDDSYGSKYRLNKSDNYATHVEINNFTSSACQVTLTNLKPSTTYYYRVYVEESFYNDNYGEVKSFTTPMNNTSGEAVDLGLSVKWASYNIGASQPEDAGAKFYWGGTEAIEERHEVDWHDFSISTLKSQGYIDNNNNLCSQYDAATQIWGNRWRMPTKNEIQELIDKCSWKETQKNGKDVYLITGPNSNFIYLPCRDHWSSTCNSSNAYNFDYYLYTGYISSWYKYRLYDRSRGCLFSIRPVLK